MIRKKVKTTTLFMLLFLAPVYLYLLKAQDAEINGFSCFSVLAGKNATTDGSVMFAHNEDDYGKRLVNWYKVPRVMHDHGEKIILKNGAEAEQVKETCEYLWLEMPEMEFSDTYFNEYGVIIASDACSSREDSAEITDGGIGYWLRRLMAERSRTAKEAVRTGGRLVEKYGYTGSGRTYCIADPDEAWLMAVVNGKHWVAQRVPDDEVAVLPNYYTIGRIEPEDTVNFLGAKDIIDYAVKRGWYDPENDGEFIFRKIYGNPSSFGSMSNIARMWQGVNLLSGEDHDINSEFPFSFKPENKISVSDMINVLRDHYENTVYETKYDKDITNPHNHKIMRICSNTNQYGFIAQLRSNMPAAVGTVLWLAPRRPCIQPFIPWYSGMDKIPDKYSYTDHKTALKQHFNPPEDIYKDDLDHAFLMYVRQSQKADEDHRAYINKISGKNKSIQQGLFDQQKAFEEKVLQVYEKDPVKAAKMLSEYTLKCLAKIVID